MLKHTIRNMSIECVVVLSLVARNGNTGYNFNLNMSSLKATTMATKVLENLRSKKPKTLGQIALESGYSKAMSTTPSQITRTKAYIEAIKPIVPQIEAERQRVMNAMGKKDLKKEKYSVLLSGADILTKNIQLLSGKATENVAIKIEISEALANKYANNTTQKDESVK